MAAKGIQAVVIDASKSTPIKAGDKELFKITSRTLARQVNETPQTAKTFRNLGTAAMVDVGQGLGFLPVRNFTRGRFDRFEQINGQALFEAIDQRGGEGKTSHACMPGCLVQCSNVYPDETGKHLVSPLEYETIGLLGPNLDIGDLDTIAQLNFVANDAGVDTVEAGAAIGVAMQAGLAEFGDGEAALKMMREIRDASILGRVLGAGADTTAKVLGVYQVPTAKGQGFPAYDPRALKGLAATYATSPMGADHTAGHTIRIPVKDHHDAEGQAAASRQAQIGVLQWDLLGFCYFLGTAVADMNLICDLIRAVHGVSVSPRQIRELSVKTLRRERQFNRAAGFGSGQDRLSEFFHKVANLDTGTVCDIDEEDIRDLMNDETLS
jgi:aldehyde:ferredoxin oxidoreductase